MLLHSWKKVADGRDLDEKLAEAGIGGSNKSSAQDVFNKYCTPTGRVIFLPASLKGWQLF